MPAMKIVLLCLSIAFALTVQSQETGIELYSFRNQFPNDVKGTLDKIKSFGITAVEGGESYGMPISEFQVALKERNIKVVSIGAEFKDLENNIDSVIGKAKSYGSKYVVCFGIPHQPNQLSIAELEYAVQVFTAAGKKLKSNGIELCYHPHGFEFRPYKDGTMFDEFVRRLDPSAANFEMDVFWVKHPGQDPVALLKKYPTRFKLLHLKDRQKGTEGNQSGEADVETNVVLGTGDVDIAEVIRQARKNKIKYMFIEDESSRSMEQVPQSIRFINSVR
jgi:sugar phosphate isomerase/epimerase